MGAGRRRIVWTESARRDLDEAISYVAESAPTAAARLLGDILAAAESLASMSERGRIVPERSDPEIREVLVDPFRILYRVADSALVVLAVLHQRRDFDSWSRQGRP